MLRHPAFLLLALPLQLGATNAQTPWSIPGLTPEVAEIAQRGWQCAQQRGDGAPVVTIIDFSRPSTEKRLWVYDVASGKVLFHELVAHGKNTGDDLATRFSNTPGSLQSSLGWFKTGGTYVGKHGRSLYLDGLESGWNDNARSRAVVMHGADYVSDDFAAQHGRLGRSWGCPALDDDVAQVVIDAIRDGSLLLAYYPDEGWLSSSAYLNCGG